MELLFQRDRDRETLLAMIALFRASWTALPRTVGKRLEYLGWATACYAGKRQKVKLNERGERMAAIVSNLFNDGNGKDITK